MIVVIYKGYEDLFAKLGNDVHDVVMRLHAVRLGHNDPGPGKGAEFAKSWLLTEDEITRNDAEAARSIPEPEEAQERS